MTEAIGNWGRWGKDDERGALNRLDCAATLRGMACVETGETVSLALPLKSGKGPVARGRQPMQHFMTRDGGDYAAGLPEPGFGFSDDYFVMPTQGTTHLDALAHIFRDGQMWNGHSANLVTSRGAKVCGIEKTGPIVTRGVFLDFGPPDGPCKADPDPIHPDDLATEVERLGITPHPGDALIIRTGWLSRWRAGQATEDKWAGLHASCAAWVDDQGFSLVCADNMAVELGPTGDPNDAAPLHVELMRNRGVHFAELFDLEELATKQRNTFLLMISPLTLQGGTGSPINPVAVL